MFTPESLKLLLDAAIRNKTAAGSLTPGDEADAIQRGYDYTDQEIATIAEALGLLQQAFSALPQLSQDGQLVVTELHLQGADEAETESRSVRSLNGVGTQVNGGYIFNANPEMITQGNAGVAIDGNWFWKIGGHTWFFHANGRLGVNIDTDTPTAQLDLNGPTGYEQLRLRTAFTPTGSADSRGEVGAVAWDENYFHLKTAGGWKRAALSPF